MTRMKARPTPRNQRESGGGAERVLRRGSNATPRAVGRATQEQSICEFAPVHVAVYPRVCFAHLMASWESCPVILPTCAGYTSES